MTRTLTLAIIAALAAGALAMWLYLRPTDRAELQPTPVDAPIAHIEVREFYFTFPVGSETECSGNGRALHLGGAPLLDATIHVTLRDHATGERTDVVAPLDTEIFYPGQSADFRYATACSAKTVERPLLAASSRSGIVELTEVPR